MAVTKIWDVRGSLDAPIKYVSNEEKTENPDLNDHTQEELQTLDDVIEYAANEDKTEMKYFVSTLNCNKNFARDEFQMVKKRFEKEGGIHTVTLSQEGRRTISYNIELDNDRSDKTFQFPAMEPE